MKTWKERLSLALALLMLILCISACDPAEPGENTDSTTVATESTGSSEETEESTDFSESAESTAASDGTETTGASDPTETTAATEPTETTAATEPPETQAPTTRPTTGPTTGPTASTTPPETTAPPAAAGTAENPAALVIGSSTAATTGKGGYYFSWTAASNGTLTLQMPDSNWSYEIHNLTAGEAVTQKSNSRDSMPIYTVKIAVLKGDSLQIIINTAKGTKGSVKFSAEFSTELIGTQEEPFHVSIENVTGIRVPAGQTIYFSGRVYGSTLVVKNAGDAKLVFDKTEYTPANGVIRVKLPEAQAGQAQALVFAITNQSGAAQVYTVEFEIPVGTLNNPEKLTLGDHTVSIAANSQGYVYEWTATADGTLTVEMRGNNWYYQLYNLNSYRVEEGNSRDNSTNPVSLAVKAGQVVKITINTGDSKAEDITFTASFA